MNIFNVISLAGGLALFLYGMTVLGNSLKRASSGKLEQILENLTNNILKSVLLGAVVTAAIQSSSATTVIVIGLVNAGILKLGSAVGVIMGANIGTTVTSQLLRLGDIENDPNANILLQFLKPKTLAPIIAVIGILLFMVAKRSKYRTIGEIMLGFGVLFNGMFAMEAAVSGLSDVPYFRELFLNLSNPVLGVLVGTVVTALIQSSSASVGILQALSSTGLITYSAAFPIIMGQNIGTCVTAILSSIGANINAKRAAMVHLYFNILGTGLFLICVYSFQNLHGFSFWDSPINRGGIANFHTIFNISITLFFIPFSFVLEKLACWTIRTTSKADESTEIASEGGSLDERFLNSPSIAIQQAQKSVIQMGKYAQYNFREMRNLFYKFDNKVVERINENEQIIDKLEDRLNHYLLLLNDCELSENENRKVTSLLHLLSEYERIGDYTINIIESAEDLYNKQIVFSTKAINELKILCNAIDEIIDISIIATTLEDISYALKIEPLEEIIDQMVDELKSTHIERFKTGQCAVEAGVIFLDILTNLERISDHCSNIGVYLISNDAQMDKLNRHEYIQTLHEGGSKEYQLLSEVYAKKYSLH